MYVFMFESHCFGGLRKKDETLSVKVFCFSVKVNCQKKILEKDNLLEFIDELEFRFPNGLGLGKLIDRH